MTDINSVVVVGRIVADVESSRNGFGYTQSGYAVARVSVAVNRGRKQGDQWVEEASFLDVTVWGKTAESLRPYLKKGQQIAVEGFLKQERWEKDGQKFSRVGIVATSVQLCGSRQNGMSQQNGFRSPCPWKCSCIRYRKPYSGREDGKGIKCKTTRRYHRSGLQRSAVRLPSKISGYKKDI